MTLDKAGRLRVRAGAEHLARLMSLEIDGYVMQEGRHSLAV